MKWFLSSIVNLNHIHELNPGNWQPPGTEAAGVIAENFIPQKFGGAHQYRNYINITDIEARAASFVTQYFVAL